MIVALFANMDKRNSYETALEIRDFLQSHGVTVIARQEEAKQLGVPSLNSFEPKKIDILISLGGDGTILRLVHQNPRLDAPILGINLGHLGFMADVPLSSLEESLIDLIEKRFRIEERLMIEGRSANGELCFAVNDFVIHRGKNPSLIDMEIHVDGIYLNTFSADGIIVATANGSTAYSLSAGGPILSPHLEAVVITPISPHTISNRPIVLLPKDKIEIKYLSPYEPVDVTYDGFSHDTVATGETFTIQRSSRTFKMVNLDGVNHFSTLRSKLGWSGQVRYSHLNQS